MKNLVWIFFLVFCVGCAKKSGGGLIEDSQSESNGSLDDGSDRADDPSVVEGELVGDSADVIDPVGPEVGRPVIDGGGEDLGGGTGEDVGENAGENVSEDENEANKGDASLTKATTFHIDSGLYALNNGVGTLAVRWDGCDKDQYSQGGYESDTKCGKAFLLPEFRQHLEVHFQRCVIDAALAAGLEKPVYAFIRHVGTYNNRDARGSSSKSLHAYARAVDIRNINLVDAGGKRTQISTHIRDYDGTTAKFYDGVRRCWSDTLPAACSPGQSEYLGSIGHTSSQLGGNSLHSDHLHLSYPFCTGG